MARDLNKVMLIGYLGADPEMRYTSQGSAVTTYSVASSRSWKSSDGVQHDDTEWFRIVAWDKLGEICNQYLTKGTRVYVEGRLQTRKWQDRDGQDRYTTEVIANDMIILSSKQDRLSPSRDYDMPVDEDVGPIEEPVQAPSGNGNGRGSSSRRSTRNVPQTIENDEDLPF
ncbi:MAG: single-stranded DNA-binding protein [Chloroflexi bacterium AL-W]|nr:single-stranded DNA-binding protein [Chloroflexi bacterium AL-N1]NOK67125.1 single-stranded DNA-binding protein [Chloroflexi bacterium AL-N10]NOK74582.1 single-stranded DNA-binding protein [Chloroflexi bacterium AL-N5]NOK81727.1 single-stranded DNA-binding protein [Chloroflexi bacterium AL-W]NOK89197.1 single-stranded DNA-binding protein [Chloroflexi bacterium AL-N15]